MIYLKTVTFANNISSAIKITSKGILNVDLLSISIDENTLDTLSDEAEWYKTELDYKECTKQDFDNLYIDAVKNINELSKL